MDIQLENYNSASEITVLAVCFTMLMLLIVSFKVRVKTYRIFATTLTMLIVATGADLMLHYLLDHNPETPLWILYSLRSIYHFLLLAMLHHYVSYTCEATYLSKKRRKPYMLAAAVLLIAFSAADIIGIWTGRFMRIVDGQIAFDGSAVFAAGYICFVTLILFLLVRVRKRLYRQVMNGFFGVTIIALTIMVTSRIRVQSTFTASTFLLPLIAVMYLLHSNPYDAELGANDLRGMNNLIRYISEKDSKYLIMSLYMRELDESGATLSEEMRTLIRHVAETFFRKSTLFKVSNGHMMLMVPVDKNPGYEERLEKVLEQFMIEYENFRYDYKLVYGISTKELNRKNEYINFVRSIHARMPENAVYQVQQGDLEKYRQYEIILRQLADIAGKKDLNDQRVLVYCQPVYNIRTGRYDTAEALMRLRLEGIGLVYPDQFIPMAEENRYIHALTEIILSKTCRVLHNLVAEGFDIRRISVNVSALELRDPGFCEDINRIIDSSGVDSSRIAIELTESRNESDFLLMKERIEELKKRDITFYLDDFGTGYSNMERILELPFDIIKFDRSMLIAGSQSKKTQQVLGNLADLFSRLNYSVLYEGVEDEKDEKLCISLSASYLQGYKYSKPIPIGELRGFLAKGSQAS